MSENVNPLLFSATASSSVFDSFSSGAVLLPPQELSSADKAASPGGSLVTSATTEAAEKVLQHSTTAPSSTSTNSTSSTSSNSLSSRAHNNSSLIVSQRSSLKPSPDPPQTSLSSNNVPKPGSSFLNSSDQPFIQPPSHPSPQPPSHLLSKSSTSIASTSNTTPTTSPFLTPSTTPIAGPPVTPTTIAGPPRTQVSAPSNKSVPLPSAKGNMDAFALVRPPSNAAFTPSKILNNQGFVPIRPPSNPGFVPIPSPSNQGFPRPPPSSSVFNPIRPPNKDFVPVPPTTSTSFIPIPASEQGFVPITSHNMRFPTQPGASSEASWAPPVYGASPEVESASIIPPSFENMALSGSGASSPLPPPSRYQPVIPHWFYGRPDATATVLPFWRPFSFTDSINLEEAFRNGGGSLVSTDGGRYDVDVSARVRRPVYWGAPVDESAPDSGRTSSDEQFVGSVRRCSWFKKTTTDVTPQPYEEDVAEKLEEAYRGCVENGVWQRQVEVVGRDGGQVVFDSPHSLNHYTTTPATFPTSVSIAEGYQASAAVSRGAGEFEVSDGEAAQVDHLLLLVHGIGPVCDLSFRGVEECVDTFRELGQQLVGAHFKQSVESGVVGRVELLPVAWHKPLHSHAHGIDARLRPITLRSIPKLREFTNDTILDVLLYTSPVYCQLIIDTVTSELNRLYALFLQRNPTFTGGVSVIGHSLGTVILFDLLMHQPSSPTPEQQQCDKSGEDAATSTPATDSPGDGGGVEAAAAATDSEKRSTSAAVTAKTAVSGFQVGGAGTGQPSIVYPRLAFRPHAVFLMGSPVAMFLSIRGDPGMGPEYALPSCPRVFNIFHPYDPVAYRLETLIRPDLTELRPLLVPHHKGRKRMHLELKDTLERVGGDLRHRIVDSLQSTWNKLYHLYAGPSAAEDYTLDQAVENQLGRLGLGSAGSGSGGEKIVMVGQLNGGRRIDYVLQEKPYESFTEYIFALTAHLSYWTSEDTLLLILKEIYSFMGINSDVKNNPQGTTSPNPSGNSEMVPHANASPVPLFCVSPQEESLHTNGSATSGGPLPQPLPTAAPLPPQPQFSDAGSPESASPPRVIGGRPVVDITAQAVGMDPTADPNMGTALPPPPMGGPGGTFIRMKPFKR